MARVRPGEEETLAAFSPNKPLIRLDLPTLERPRNANSGAVAEGNCSGAIADSRNFVTRCILATARAAARLARVAEPQPAPRESPRAAPARDPQAQCAEPHPS